MLYIDTQYVSQFGFISVTLQNTLFPDGYEQLGSTCQWARIHSQTVILHVYMHLCACARESGEVTLVVRERARALSLSRRWGWGLVVQREGEGKGEGDGVSLLLSLSLSSLCCWSHCKVAPESWGIGGSKVVSSKRLEGYEMFNPRNSRREDREEENA